MSQVSERTVVSLGLFPSSAWHTLSLFVVTVLALVASVGASRAAEVHFIVAADTLDESIGESVKIDARRVAFEMEKVEKYTSLKVRRRVIAGEQLTRDNVLNAVQSVQCSQEDVVFFYYSGHGFRLQNMGDRWPAISLRQQQGVETSRLYNILSSKNPRLLLVIADCCNNVIPDGVINLSRAKPDLDSPAARSAYQSLFERSRGGIIASSSQPGQVSQGNNRDGGLFTVQFVSSLQTWLSNDSATWSQIFRVACREIHLGQSFVQSPQYQLFGDLAGNTSAPPPSSGATPTPPNSEASSNASGPLVLSLNGVNCRVVVREARGAPDSGRLSLNGVYEYAEVYATRNQKIRISMNGTSCMVDVPRSFAANVKGQDNGVGNRIAYYDTTSTAANSGSAPSNPPPAGTPNTPAAAGGRVSLTIRISGLGNQVSIIESNQQPHEGEHRVSGMGENLQFRLAPNTNVHLVINGLQNQITIPEALRGRAKITQTGLNNQVEYR